MIFGRKKMEPYEIVDKLKESAFLMRRVARKYEALAEEKWREAKRLREAGVDKKNPRLRTLIKAFIIYSKRAEKAYSIAEKLEIYATDISTGAELSRATVHLKDIEKDLRELGIITSESLSRFDDLMTVLDINSLRLDDALNRAADMDVSEAEVDTYIDKLVDTMDEEIKIDQMSKEYGEDEELRKLREKIEKLKKQYASGR